MFAPERHTIMPDGDWLTAVRAAATREGMGEVAPRLFVYHHEMEDTFVLAFWLVGPGEGLDFLVMQELIAMDGPPGHEKYRGKFFSVKPMTDVLASLRPSGEALALVRKTCEDHEDRLRRQEERNKIARGESDRYLKKTTGVGIPINAPFHVSSDAAGFVELMAPKKTY